MSPRDRRLSSDLEQMSLLARGNRISFRCDGAPPDEYEVLFSGAGLAPDGAEGLVVRGVHRAHVYLHLDYPRRPPVVTWLTPVFHPNLLGPDRNGGVCIGSWSAAESLADLCERLLDLATWKSLNPGDPLNREAASWAQALGVEPGSDVTRFASKGRAVPLISVEAGA